MGVSPLGDEVYVAVFESGNRSTVLGGGAVSPSFPFPPQVVNNGAGPYSGVNPFPNNGVVFEPLVNPALLALQPVALIVKQDAGGVWRDDNGTSWSTPGPLNTDQALTNNVVQWLPSISVTAQGYVLATWYDRRNTTDGLNYEYYGRLSLDNGLTFLPDEPLSDVAVPQPTQVDPNVDYCFAGDSNFHGVLSNHSLVTWTDGRNAISEEQQMDVFYDLVPLCPEIIVSPDVLPNGERTEFYDETWRPDDVVKLK